jgi:hypothetical protein
LQRAVCAEIEGGTGGESLTRVKLADCGRSPAGQLLAGLAAALGSAAAASAGGGCVFVFAEHDQAGFTRWATAPAARRVAAEPIRSWWSGGADEITPGSASFHFVTLQLVAGPA